MEVCTKEVVGKEENGRKGDMTVGTWGVVHSHSQRCGLVREDREIYRSTSIC